MVPLGFRREPSSGPQRCPITQVAIAVVAPAATTPCARSLRRAEAGEPARTPDPLPLFFSLLTVITAAAPVPVFGELITDPIETVERIDTRLAVLLGGLTFIIATLGIRGALIAYLDEDLEHDSGGSTV
ncbi:hypothetical protein [Rathayibacter tritici]|nr:hypothetical protein [Rathayibacter tritici]